MFLQCFSVLVFWCFSVLGRLPYFSGCAGCCLGRFPHFGAGLLNAKLIWFYLDKVASKLQGGAFAMQSPYVLSIPVVKEVVEDAKFEALAREVLRRKEVE